MIAMPDSVIKISSHSNTAANLIAERIQLGLSSVFSLLEGEDDEFMAWVTSVNTKLAEFQYKGVAQVARHLADPMMGGYDPNEVAKVYFPLWGLPTHELLEDVPLRERRRDRNHRDRKPYDRGNLRPDIRDHNDGSQRRDYRRR